MPELIDTGCICARCREVRKLKEALLDVERHLAVTIGWTDHDNSALDAARRRIAGVLGHPATRKP